MEAPATSKEVGPGTVIAGTYRIERVLGEGGMGLVFEARHLRVPKRVAIKVLRTTPDQEQLARFRQEAEIASSIGHPNIIDVLDFDMLPSGVAYLVMELLEGESLAAKLRRGTLPMTEALPIIRQIASALHAAHQAGVVHRDLKPENVFLVPRDLDGMIGHEVKILDFGISKVHGSQIVRTREDVVLGTPKYMAPEQAVGRSEDIDARADQFALGVMAYEMISGRAPFDADTATAVMFKIVYEDPLPLGPLVPNASTTIVAAIERAMSKRPNARFPDVSQFIGALTGRPLAERGSQPSLPPFQTTSKETVRATPGTAPSERAAPPPRGRMEPTAAASRPATDDPVEKTPAATVRSGPRGRAESADRADSPPTVKSGPRLRPAPEEPAAAPRRSPLVWLVPFGAIAAAGIAVAVLVLGDDKPKPRPERAGGSAATIVAATTVDAPPVVEPVIDAAITVPAVVDAAPRVDAARVDATRVDARRPSSTPRPPDPAMPPEAAREQAAAEAALREGRLQDASAAARRVLQFGKYSRAYYVLIELACIARDLGAAHAWMRNLSPSAWPAARVRCAKHGFRIENPS